MREEKRKKGGEWEAEGRAGKEKLRAGTRKEKGWRKSLKRKNKELYREQKKDVSGGENEIVRRVNEE